MKRLIVCLLVCILVLPVAFSCFAKDLKVGYVNVIKVLNDYEKTKAYDATLEKKLKAAEKQLSSKKEAIEKSQSKLSLLKEKDKEREEEKIRKQVIEFQELNRKAFIDAKKERDEKMKEISTDINKVVAEYAKKNGFTLVINQAAILYGDSVMDITSEVLKIANQNYEKMMKFTLGEIAELVKGELVGDPGIVVTGISGIKEAKEGDITFLANSKYYSLAQTTKATAIITSREEVEACKPLIRTDNPSVAFTTVVGLVEPDNIKHPQGIHPTAIISDGANLGKNVGVGAYVIIEDGVQVGDDTIIYGGCYIGHHAKIGSGCLVYPHVAIRERNEVGNRVIIHCGTVIGSDGFGFAMVRGVQKKIPQIGIVLIEDDVEIGANVTIDRARFDKTIIGKGTKVDNLVQIAHNVVTGENCIIVAQAGVSGSTVLGNGVILAGQAGIVGHIRIGDRAVVAAQAGVTKSIPAETKVSGYPAKQHAEAKRVNACLQRLPELYKKIKDLEEKVKELEEKAKVR